MPTVPVLARLGSTLSPLARGIHGDVAGSRALASDSPISEAQGFGQHALKRRVSGSVSPH